MQQVIVADNYFTGSKDNLQKWIGHPRFELIRHGKLLVDLLVLYYLALNPITFGSFSIRVNNILFDIQISYH